MLLEYGQKILAFLNRHPELVTLLALGFVYQVSTPLLLAFESRLAKLSPGAVHFLRSTGFDAKRGAAMLNRAIYAVLRRYVPAIPPPVELEESERKAKTDPPPSKTKTPPGAAVGLLFCLGCFVLAVFLSGCEGYRQALDDAAESVRASSQVADVAEPCLFAMYQAEQERCKALPDVAAAEACVLESRSRWDSTRKALASVRKVRCSVAPDDCSSGLDGLDQ